MSDGFQAVLDHIRSIASTEAEKGRLFERLMKAYLRKDPVYRDRFRDVWLWSEWAIRQPGFDGVDTGIDLVAEERDGGYGAIQCKCYQPGTRLRMGHLSNFIAASARDPFTRRLFVDTGDEWGPNARKTFIGLKPECQVLRFGDLASRPVDWPDLVWNEPEDLGWRHEPYSLRPHQQAAFDDVTGQFGEHDRGKLVMACGTGKTFTALRTAESMAGVSGRVLYLVPSISLLQQSMREWAEQRAVPHSYIGICSDTRAGRTDEDAPIQELEIPVTTDPKAISSALRVTRADAMAVVFSTYHSLGIVEDAVGLLPVGHRSDAYRCEVKHVDGKHHALDRKARIDWLKGDTSGACRILSNARCLSEGIDVPALDAVLFMSSRSSQVDIVQAVGRAMRKSPGKEYGYIILPVTVPAGIDPARALDDNKRFAGVWGVLRALRSHDDRFDAEINQIDLNRTPTERIIFSGDGANGQDGDEEGGPPASGILPFPPLDLPPGAIYAKIVEKCGDRKYWETWAKDVADIFLRLTGRIENLLAHPDNDALREWFEAFRQELRISINDSITRDNAIEMMAQHILTRPVFEALFEHYDFAGSNPVARALDALRSDFGEFGLENETRDLERFYESVRMRARGLDNSQARQRVLMELYEKFFATALKKEADRLGIVYTPVEVVDFILASADRALQREFGRSLGDEGVHVLDPFTGTGIFLVRLIQSALIADKDLARKFREELHANEIVLLAYYIAAIHIEEAFHGRRGDIGDYLKREEKLAILKETGSIGGVDDWREITPDKHHDWIGQRDEAFQALYPIGSKAAKAGKTDNAIFTLFSNGYKTSRDAYIYNFSEDACETNARAMVDNERTILALNDRIRLENVPAGAHAYEVNGRTPLEWFIDRYRIKRDNRSGIVNDPNGWFDDPRDLVASFRRIVHVSVETARIVRGLPEPFDEAHAEQPDGVA